MMKIKVHGPWFNPMYLDSKCKGCSKFVGCICAYCDGSVCRNCHEINQPTAWEKFKSIFVKEKR